MTGIHLHLVSPNVQWYESSGLAGREIPLHRHEETLFTQVLEGDLSFQDRGTNGVLRAGPGDVVILPAASVVAGELGGRSGWRVRTLRLDDRRGPIPGEGVVTVLEAGKSSLASEFDTVFSSWSDERVRARWLEQTRGLLEWRAPRFPLPSPPVLWKLEQARRTIDSQPERVPALRELGRLTGWHPHHLQRLFRRRFGVTPSQYHAHRRVTAALRLLAEGLPAADVATQLGFADQSHFIRTFRRHLGVTPGAVSVRNLARRDSGTLPRPQTRRSSWL